MFTILSLFILCSLFAYAIETTKNERKRNLLIVICLLYLTFVSGTRLVGGMDFPTYAGHYHYLATFPSVLNPARVNQHYEIGYTYIASFFKTLGISFYGFCLIHAAIFYTCLWKGLSRYTHHFGIVILIFLYKLFFYNTMISMRQSLTIALFLLMIPLIEERKWIKYYICAFFAAKIHNGGYLLFLLYPLSYIHLTKKKILWLNILFLPTMFIGFTGIDVLGPVGTFLSTHASSETMAQKATSYFNNENLSPIGIFHTLEYFLAMAVFYLNADKFNYNDKKTQMVLWMFLCLLPLFTLFRGSEILTREKDYFTIFYAVLLGMLVDVLPKQRALVYAFIVTLCAFGYYRYVILFDGGHFLTYRSWLFDSHYHFFK